jgi:NADPH:quinone reductase-like Zn-dependent oxidoreductase
MRAALQERYGSPEILRVAEVERPAPAADEILVRVRATTVNRTDTHMRAAKPFIWRFMAGFRRPKQRIAGREFAGEVAEVGSNVTEFAPGDRVFGIRAGSNAEYVCVREGGLVAHIPAGMSFEGAAAICDGAYQGLMPLRKVNVGEGTRVLIYGATGSCGTAAVQLARHFGAHVTAVANTKNLELVRSLGADEVIDYLNEDFTKSGQSYDVILDAVGKLSFRRTRGSLRPGGLWVATDGLHNFLWRVWTSRIGDRKLIFTVEWPTKEDIRFFKELIEAGEYRAVIDRTYLLEEIVEAHRYVETMQKTGNVVITLNGGQDR